MQTASTGADSFVREQKWDRVMESVFLQKETFEAWASSFDKRLDDALALREEVVITGKKVAVLEDRSESTRRLAFSGVISSVVSAAIAYVLGHR